MDNDFLNRHARHLSPEEIIRYAEQSEHPLVVAFIESLNRKWQQEFAGAAYTEGTRQMREELASELMERLEAVAETIDTLEEVLLAMAARHSYDELPDAISRFFEQIRKKDFLNLPTV